MSSAVCSGEDRPALMVHLGSLGEFISGSGFPREKQGIVGEKYPYFKVASLSNTDRHGAILGTKNTVSEETASELGAKIIPANSILMAKIGEAIRLSRFAINSVDCCIDNNMLAIVPYSDHIDNNYLRMALSLVPVDTLIKAGPVPSLDIQGLRGCSIPLPTMETQRRIAAYLSRETAEIDAAVADLDRYIKLLDKRKWEKLETLLENSPHDKIRLSVAAKMTTGTTPSRLRPSEEGILWLKPDGLSPQSTGARIATDVVLNNLVSPAGTTYVCGIGATVGKVGYCEEKATTNQQITALVPSIDVLPKLFYYSVSSLTDWFRGTAPGSTLPILNNVRLGTYSVRIPHLAVQHKVLDAIDSLFNETNRIAMESKTLRDLLLKRRSVLITEVVTGRRQV